MIKRYFIINLLIFCINVSSFSQWSPIEGRIKTIWGENIDVDNVLPEYPRPIMERQKWMNLNGLWEYSIASLKESKPIKFDGEILVPFAVESSLSGVGKKISNDSVLWYEREFYIPSEWNDERILLHFGAVDWKADVWVNDVKVGEHTGGYTPFTFDITQAIKKGKNILNVKVWDPTDKGPQPRGKQVSNPNGIWYTPVSGIWQTVWLEPVPKSYIESIKITPDIDLNKLYINVKTNNYNNSNEKYEVKVFGNDKLVATGTSINGLPVEVTMPSDVKYWSPESPYLYDLEISLVLGNKEIDKIQSYAAMRKFSMKKDNNGIVRMQLNNKNIFHFGPLDQGWWPDGLYTAPSDEALKFDIERIKSLGYNMVRKHIKVEPARWYTYCDRMGVIVWQDMPSGDKMYEWNQKDYYIGEDNIRSIPSEKIYKKEWKEIIDYLYSYPSIGVWVPFNEAWGQFKTNEIAEWTKNYDPTRLVNPASGGNHFTCGDILDIHSYPSPEMFLYDAQRVNVLGEYGGIGLVVKNHLWEPKRNWGYIQFNSEKEATNEYIKYAEILKRLIERGFSAAVYTQLTDVEIEVNGLMTYDRKKMKMNENELRRVNINICNSLKQ